MTVRCSQDSTGGGNKHGKSGYVWVPWASLYTKGHDGPDGDLLRKQTRREGNEVQGMLNYYNGPHRLNCMIPMYVEQINYILVYVITSLVWWADTKTYNKLKDFLSYGFLMNHALYYCTDLKYENCVSQFYKIYTFVFHQPSRFFFTELLVRWAVLWFLAFPLTKNQLNY